MNLDIDSTPFTKINSKWIIMLNVKHRVIRFLEDNTEENPDDFGYGDGRYNTKSMICAINNR